MNYKNKLILDNSGKSPAFYLKKNKNFITKDNINFIKNFSNFNKIDSRICLHKNSKDKIQFMVNALYKTTKKYYYNYHKSTDEYYFIISGKLQIIYFDKLNKKRKIVLSKNSNELFKMNKKIIHVTIPLTKVCVYLEIRQGPFISKTDSIFTKNFEKLS